MEMFLWTVGTLCVFGEQCVLTLFVQVRFQFVGKHTDFKVIVDLQRFIIIDWGRLLFVGGFVFSRPCISGTPIVEIMWAR